MRRLFPLITVCLLLSAAADPLFAQQRLFALVPGQLVELDSRLPSLGAVLRSVSLPGDIFSMVRTKDHVFPFLGGAYLVWALDGHVSLLDTRSGAIQLHTFPDFIPEQIVGTDGNARLVISGRTAAQNTGILVADVRSGSQRVFDLGPSHLVGSIAYAVSSDLLFVAKARREEFLLGTPVGFDFFDVGVVQVGTGAVLKTVDVAPLDTRELRTNAVGTRLFVNRRAAFDVITGALAANITAPVPQADALVVDDHRQRVIFGGEQLQAFSMDSLDLLGTTALPSVPRINPAGGVITGDTDVSAQSATIFLARNRVVSASSYYRCDTKQLAAIDADTGRVRAIADASSFLPERCSVDLIRITEPAAPLGFTAQASGHQVTLEWHAALNATSYEIEAGSASGLKNIATLIATDTHLTVDEVPPGVYYIRVRGINTIGKSAASQEVQLVVE